MSAAHHAAPPPALLEGARLPVYSWARDLEAGASAQALATASLDVAFHHVAVMADGHQGFGVPIGAVVALKDAVAPYAVGNDIGCGMAVVPTELSRHELLDRVPTRSGRAGPIARDDVMGWIQTTIPSGSDAHPQAIEDAVARAHLVRGYHAMAGASGLSGVPLSTSQSPRGDRGQPLTQDSFVRRGLTQLGTLGSGNHFIELLSGADDQVWVMVHSGSRGVGGAVCNNFHRMAVAFCDEHRHPLPDQGLAWLPASGSDRWAAVGNHYVEAMQAALLYAEQNRRHMLETAAAIIERRFPQAMRWGEMIDIHHNDAAHERHFGEHVWVHRKGAVKAARGTPTITPGSMGTATWIGEGLGNDLSFESCSHGAGRTRSRGQARAELSLQHELATISAAGGKVFASSREDVLDEMPGAYKDLDDVMAAQAALVRPVLRLTPLGTYKGTERRRRRGRGSGWRPEEER